MVDANLKRENLNTIRLTKLKLQLETYKEVVKRTQTLVIKEQAAFDDKMQDIWNKTLDFIEKTNSFHDTRGISSPWWNAQVRRMQNPAINQETSGRRLRKNALTNLEDEIKNMKEDLAAKEKELSLLKEKVSNETVKVQDFKKNESELQQEPFGFEFISMKAQVESSKRTCLQLRGSLLSSSSKSGLTDKEHSRDNYSGFRFHPKAPTFIDENNFQSLGGEPCVGETMAKKSKKVSKFLKIRERTTLIYRRGQLNAAASNPEERGTQFCFPQENAEHINSEENEVTHS